MIKISVPATSANLGPGFDTLGIAFELYNSFLFEKSENIKLNGFMKKYENNNLVLFSYKKVFQKFSIPLINVSITMSTQDVPTSRGLGSSATCIVAGVLAAKYFIGDKITMHDVFDVACEIEGHPDNIAPALFGGLISSYKNDDGYKYVKYDVSNKLLFNVLVPPFELSTHDARAVLPKSLDYNDITFNTSRVANIPYALAMGKMDLIYDLLNDKMHEPYRMSLIKGADKVKDIAHNNNCSFSISGAGPSLLIISDHNINDLFDAIDFKMYNLKVAHDGAIIKEM